MLEIYTAHCVFYDATLSAGLGVHYPQLSIGASSLTAGAMQLQGA
jgi:hypothetical protein